ncbi:MAG TPA: stage V sporulation protein SpoVM [Ruminococcus sp.]|nr:stage V sporulation protein SpoVM [Ruminococcus sp.]
MCPSSPFGVHPPIRGTARTKIIQSTQTEYRKSIPPAEPKKPAHFFQHGIYCIITEREGCSMKVVVVRSPRLLAGLLRMVFRIRREPRSPDA